MSNPDESRRIAEGFVEAWNSRDVPALGALMHERFTWHIAVTDHGVAEMRPLQSKLLAGMNLSWEKSIFDKAETLKIFERIFATTSQFTIAAKSFTAQDDRIAIELVGHALNEANGRQYRNIYCYIFQLLEGKIVLFREYQDTLLLFDVWVAA